MAEDPPISATDENQAHYVPSDVARSCYHCPNTMCDGHFYLAPRDLGRESICPKCGLPVTIGKQVVPQTEVPSVTAEPVHRLWAWCLAMLLIGAVAGFLAAALMLR
jgi:hypothetical protein